MPNDDSNGFEDSSTCKFCGSKNIRSGSWSNDTCMNCGAIYFFGSWIEKEADDAK